KWIAQVPVAALQAAATTGAGTTQTMSQFWEGENMTTDSRRKLVFMSRDQGNKGQFIVDIKDPWNPVIDSYSADSRQGHTSTCVNDCRFLWSVGTVESGGPSAPATPVSVTDVRDPMHPFGMFPLVSANVGRAGVISGSTHSVDVDFNGV